MILILPIVFSHSRCPSAGGGDGAGRFAGGDFVFADVEHIAAGFAAEVGDDRGDASAGIICADSSAIVRILSGSSGGCVPAATLATVSGLTRFLMPRARKAARRERESSSRTPSPGPPGGDQRDLDAFAAVRR